ncbi:MAG: amidohydrolase family protein [Chloroflexota bacterium]
MARLADRPVIDADGHFHYPESVWDDYLDTAYWEERPRMVPDNGGTVRLMIEGVLYPRSVGTAPGLPWGAQATQKRRRGASDPHERIKDMDLEGISQALCFPTFGPLFSVHDPGLAGALARAHNQWARDYCGAYPDRLKAIPALPVQHQQAAVEELRRVLHEGWVGGVFLLPNVRGMDLHHPYFSPFFEAAQEAGLPVMIHAVAVVGEHFHMAGAERTTTFFQMHTALHPFEQMLAVMSILANGLLDRYPRLKVVFLESGVGWVPYWLERLDEHFERLRSGVPLMARPASEYVAGGRVFFGAEAGEVGLAHAAQQIGADKLLYTSDYPHWDADLGGSVEKLVSRADLTDEAKQMILYGNARGLFPWAMDIR